jgi:LysM repeat protein
MAIVTANSLVTPYTLTPGQTLQIPGAGPILTPSPTPTGPTLTPSLTLTGPTPTPSLTLTPAAIPTSYTIHEGEYPYCVARRFNVNPDELLSLNGLSRYHKVSTGTVLQIPQTGHTFPGTRALHPHPTTYTVKSGDTIYIVACYYGDVDPMAIATANSLVAPYSLTVGQTLQIPGAGPYPTTTPTTGASSTPTLTRTPTATVTSTATTTATATSTATATPLAFTSCASIIGLTQPADCEALVALYTGTNGATWTNRTGWLATNAPCSWYGVTCTSGRVTQLVLGNNNLIGTLPSQLGSLTNLTVLNLASNQLSGTIPTELGNLVNLSSLYFQENALSGEIQTTITNLSTTVNFNIGYNMLSSTNAGVITFLNGKQANWASTQTVPPTNVLVVTTTSNSVQLSWTPITYTADGGSYEVLYATISGGPYTSHGTTIDKTASGYTVTGLTPSTTYYLVVRTTTPTHGTQQNALTSSYSLEISATTTP